MYAVFEIAMLICFGLSWPISVYKTVKNKSAKGKSLFFLFIIIIGYICGIIGKVLSGNVNYVLALYCINLAVVCIDAFLYFYYKRRETVAVQK